MVNRQDIDSTCHKLSFEIPWNFLRHKTSLKSLSSTQKSTKQNERNKIFPSHFNRLLKNRFPF